MKASELISFGREQQPLLQKYSIAGLHIDQNVMRLFQNASEISIISTQIGRE